MSELTDKQKKEIMNKVHEEVQTYMDKRDKKIGGKQKRIDELAIKMKDIFTDCDDKFIIINAFSLAIKDRTYKSLYELEKDDND